MPGRRWMRWRWLARAAFATMRHCGGWRRGKLGLHTSGLAPEAITNCRVKRPPAMPGVWRSLSAGSVARPLGVDDAVSTVVARFDRPLEATAAIAPVIAGRHGSGKRNTGSEGDGGGDAAPVG